MKLTANRIKFLLLPAVIIIAGIICFVARGGFNYDIEFMGGIRMQIDMEQSFDHEDVKELISEKTGVDCTVQTSGTNATQAIIKTPPVEESVKDDIFNAVKEAYNLSSEEPMSVSSASASFGKEVQRKAFTFTLIAILCILIYIAFRFEWRSAVMAVVALAVNVLVMLSVYAITYIPINTSFIAAMLTVIGYSINNTIVIFDRIRENMRGIKKGVSISDTVDSSVRDTMGRTINSTITTLITIVLLYFMGVSTIKEFALPLIIGILAGAYSSITIAAPWWAVWKEAERAAKREAAAAKASSKKKSK